MTNDYIRREDAVEEILKYIISSGVSNQSTWNECVRTIADTLQDMQPADVAPVVRCRNCENWQTDWNPSIPDRHYCAVMDSMMKADDFCSYGERREE